MKGRSTFRGRIFRQIPQGGATAGGRLNARIWLAVCPPARTMGRVLVGAMLGMILFAMRGSVQAQSAPAASSGATQNTPELFADQNSPQSFAASVPSNAGARFQSRPILSLPEMFARQWTPRNQRFSFQEFKTAEDNQSQKLTLKETIYLALKHNPGLASVALDPVTSIESVKAANAVFDPQLLRR